VDAPITLGLDPHPASHTVAALDVNGTPLASLTVQNTPEGLAQLHVFAAPFPERRWAVEGAANRFVSAFVGQLLERGEAVVNIPPNLASQYRARRGCKKNDVVDAQNAARALLANPGLPAFTLGERQRELQDLSRTQRRLSEQLKANQAALAELDASSPARPVLEQVVEVLRVQLAALVKQLGALVAALAPSLLGVLGVGPVVASLLLAEVGDVSRFASGDGFASYCGAAPVERGSGQNTRVQLNPGGNRRLNWALHIVAVVRLRQDERTKTLVARLKGRGKSQRAALRVLKTYIARELFGVLRQAAPAAVAAGAA